MIEESTRGTRVERFLPWIHELARRRGAAHSRKSSWRRALQRLDSLDEVVGQTFEEHGADPSKQRLRQDYLAECMEGLPGTPQAMVEQVLGRIPGAVVEADSVRIDGRLQTRIAILRGGWLFDVGTDLETNPVIRMRISAREDR